MKNSTCEFQMERLRCLENGPLAQSVEHRAFNPLVVRSSRTRLIIDFKIMIEYKDQLHDVKHRLAHLRSCL
jgi:hypothetical protein